MQKVLVSILATWSLTSSAGISTALDGGVLRLDGGAGLRAAVSPENGGELTSLEIRFAGAWRELVYRANDYSAAEGWRGKAPLLWPAVGLSLDPEGGGRGYRIDGRYYPMPPHGFARDRAWRVVEHGAGTGFAFARLSLVSDERTRALYPFDFELEVTYRLGRERLVIGYDIHADPANTARMPFSIGNHVTFRAPLVSGDPNAMRVVNDLPDRLLRADDRTFSGRVEPSPYRGDFALSAFPRRRAVSLGGAPGSAELTLTDPSGLRLTLRHAASREPAPPVIRFNVWADTQEGFVSPEPWLGTQNGLNTGAGVVRLEPGAHWRWQIEIIPSGAGAAGPERDEVSQ